MAKKQLISSSAFDELNQDLDKEGAYFLSKIVTSEWVSKTGIYKLYTIMLAGTLGFAKFLSSKEIENICFRFEYLIEIDEQKYKRTVIKQMQLIATDRLEDVFDALQKKGKIKYDYEKSLIYVKNFHKYVPFGNASPIVIIPELLAKLTREDGHPFWDEYLQENLAEIKDYLNRLEKRAEEAEKEALQKNRKTWSDIRTNANFIQLKSLIFK